MMHRWLSTVLLILLVLAVAGCEDYDSDHDEQSKNGRTYLPPPGMGSILFENPSFSDWNVSVDSIRIGRVASGSFLVRDAAPGRHTVHLDVHLGSEVEDRVVEVEEGLLSVVRVRGDSFDFDVSLFTVVP